MKIFQSYLDDWGRGLLSPVAGPWDARIDASAQDREYEHFKRIDAAAPGLSADEPWGLVSWKFEHKTGISLESFHRFCAAQLEVGFDCVYVNPMIGNEAMFATVWEQGRTVHAPMEELAAVLARQAGVVTDDPFAGARHFSFCNYFVAKPRFWRAYFEFVDRCLAVLDAEAIAGSEAGAAYKASAGHSRDPAASMKPFVVERLLSTFLQSTDSFRACGYSFDRSHFTRKFGDQLGSSLHDLFSLKHAAVASRDETLLHAWDRLRRGIVSGPLCPVVLALDDPSEFYLSRERGELREIRTAREPQAAAPAPGERLRRIFAKVPYLSIKHESYFQVYEDVLARFAGQPVTFVEVGVLNGGSLWMWREYLGPQARIIGIDLNPEALKWREHGFEIVIGDQSDPAFWDAFYGAVGKVDVVLDDGGHLNVQQIVTTEKALDHVNDGGCVIVEDVHASYLPEFGNPSDHSFVSFAKRMADAIQARFPAIKAVGNDYWKKVYSIAFHESIVVFQVDRRRCAPSAWASNGGEATHPEDFRHVSPVKTALF